MNTKHFLMYIVLAVGGSGLPLPTPAQATPPSCTSTQVSENFTGTNSNCQWNFFGGACLTAGSLPYPSALNPGLLPQCVGDTYYGGQTQVGGTSGGLPDSPVTGGALRFTNDANAQSGAIISNFAFALQGNGLHVTFTTETYEGDSGGGNQDGADGMSFFLVDDSYIESNNPVTGVSYGANNGGPYGVTLGDWGGSLGYTCSNTNNSANQGYAGMIGGYMGLGIDEFGNFLNGDTIDGAGAITYNGDNTSSGFGYVPNRVGMRGPGATAWAYLNRSPTTHMYYPSTLTMAQQVVAVHQACQTGYAWDYSTASTATSGTVTNGVANPYNATPQPTVLLSNYGAIPLANQVLPTKIANEAALYRGYATPATTGPLFGTPITYDLSISTGGLLSLSYSFGGGLYQPIITRQSIGSTLPAMVRFGFGGSTGGSRNIHEIMCFQAAPPDSSSSSAGLNQKQTAKVQTGTQVYFAFYNPNNWTGSVTSQYLDSTDGVNLQIDPALNWDASCNLTGPATGTCPSTPAGAGATAAQNPDTGRVMLTYNPVAGAGVPFTWSSAGVTPLSAPEQARLDFGDPSPASNAVWPYASNLRLEYLRGQRGDEQNQFGVDPLASTSIPAPTGFRQRTSVLGDIIDSSPTWVGPPIAAFPTIWSDFLYPSTTMPENSGPTYATFQTANTSRMNVVYAGSNDGFLHGFRSGFFDANGQLDGTTTTSPYGATDNDGQEVLAFMPAYVVDHINAGSTFNSVTGTTTPNPALDYSSPLYGHRLSVDGTPGDGDLFYNGAWHTWLVGGLGGGGSDIYALDVTNPGIGTAPGNFAEGNASSIVVGEWYSSLTYAVGGSSGAYTSTVSGATASPGFSCANVASCWQSLGKTYGTPQIRRFHNTPVNTSNGATSWGAVFGNGYGSFNGDAGIFVMLASPTGGQPSFYYLSTGYGSSTNPDGIADVTPADLDGDHITDYVYAGDLLGNVWRFDLTSQNPSSWTVTKVGGAPTPIYSTPSGAPITTKVIVASIASSPNPRVLVEFGTGVQNQFSNNGPATYATAQQYLVGVWDWNMSAWDAVSTVTYDALSSTTTPLAPTSGGVPAPINGLTKLAAQSITGSFDQTDTASGSSTSTTTAAFYRTVSTNCVGWADSPGTCTTSNQYGWYLPLGTGYANANDPEYLTPSTSQAAQFVDEQVIFNPTLQDGAFIVNTTIPPTTSVNTCSSTPAGGWTMAINPATGGAFTNSFFAGPNHQFQDINNQIVSGVALGGTGSPSVVIFDNKTYIVTQTMPPAGTIVQINPPGASQGSRLTWIERR
jgi:type IV pilus assembly protein PilY1